MSPATSHEKRGRTAFTPARVLVLILLVLVIAIIASQDALHDAFLRGLAAAQSVIARHPVLGAALFVLLAALSAMLAFFSSAVLVPVALYAWGTGLSALLLWAGWIIGGVCAYSVGRYLGQPVVARLTSRRKLQRYQHTLSDRAPFGLVLLFQLALPSEIPGYALGMANYPMSRYLLARAGRAAVRVRHGLPWRRTRTAPHDAVARRGRRRDSVQRRRLARAPASVSRVECVTALTSDLRPQTSDLLGLPYPVPAPQGLTHLRAP